MDGDMVFGAFVTVIFLAAVFAAGVLVYQFKNRRFARAWQPLVPVLGGSIHGDGGGGATSWLSGSYKGKAVHASMSPGLNDPGVGGGTHTGFAYNAFEVTMKGVPGRSDWSLAWFRASAGSASLGWRIDTRDAALAERLRTQGVVEEVARLGAPADSVAGAGRPVLRYTAREGELCYREDAGPAWAPSCERFCQELETLLRVAEINAEANPS